MHIHMVAIGSTGDVRPYVLLGKELRRRGHEVTIVAFANFAAMAEEAGLGFYPLAGDVMDFMERIMKPGVVGAKFLRQVEESLRDVAPVLLHDLMEAFRGADAMICTFFGSTYYSVAEKYGIPVVQTQYFPMDPNRQMPISSAPAWKLGPAWNLATYRLGYLLIHLLEHRYLTAWREENHVTVPRIHGGPDYTLGGHTIPVIYAISPLVVPRPAQWGRNIHMSGFWVDEESKPFVPPRELADFLAAGEKPVYIGFGSMVSGNMRKTFDVVMKAVRAAGLRVILDNGWSGAGLAGASNVFTLSSFVPHDWLFPQMRAAVHHGGAGTTAAGLRAGCPTLVIPFGGDQPFWGSRVWALGCGPKPIRRENLTVSRLTRALVDLTHHEAYARAAQALGAGLRQEHGIITAADLVEQEVRRWLAGPAQTEA